MAALSARDLSCRYLDGRRVLEGIDLELRAGELAVLCGPSAGGKTTLLRCLNGLVPRSYRSSLRTGAVLVGGRELADLDPAEVGTRVGTLLQDPVRQVVGYDVRREVAFGPENLGLPAAEIGRRVERAAARLGIARLLDRPTAELSGGELQKVALAGVLAMEPGVLLLDEPLAALDPASAAEVAELLRTLADEGRAVLVVEHRLETLLAAGPDRIVELEGGRVVHDGPPASFLARADPRHAELPVEVAVERWRALGLEPEGTPPPPPGRGDAPALELEDVSFAYSGERGGRAALDGLALRVEAGERVALLGANGSGKSTLLQLAMGLLRPSRGRVRVGGRDTADTPTSELAREVGLVFQDPGVMLFADTVEAECRFGPRNLGLAEAQVQAGVETALARFRLTELRAASPGTLSIGQKKRLTLAAVAAAGVTTWLVDEPTAGLDPAGVADFLEALLAERGTSVLFATHDLDLALVHAHRVAVMEAGRVVAEGPPGEVLRDAALLARARLLPTSLLAANAERVSAGLRPLSARELARDGGGEDRP